MKKEIIFGPKTEAFLNTAHWCDEYPAHQCYADELELLLGFLERQNQQEHYFPRLQAKPRQRDAALMEIRVAYRLVQAGFSIVDWQAVDAQGHDTEFSVSLPNDGKCFVEVKSPTWQSELTDAQRHSGRINQPKSIDGEGGAADPVGKIRCATVKALPKFTGQFPTLVVIADDCFVNLATWGLQPLVQALTAEASRMSPAGCFLKPKFASVGAVALFKIETNPLRYESLCLANPNATGARLPETLIETLQTSMSVLE